MFIANSSTQFAAAPNRGLNPAQRKLIEDGKKLSDGLAEFRKNQPPKSSTKPSASNLHNGSTMSDEHRWLLSESDRISRELDEFKRSQQK